MTQCHFNHNAEAIGIFYFPEGCFCFTDQLQALCEYHAERSVGRYPMFEFIYWGA